MSEPPPPDSRSAASRRAERIGKFLDRALERCENVAAFGAAVSIMLMLLAVAYSTVSRKFFGQSVGWVVELSAYSLVYFTFLAAAWIYRRNAHVTIDLVITLMPPRVQRYLAVGVAVVAIAVWGLVTFYSWQMTRSMYETGEIFRAYFNTPSYLVAWPFALGAALLTLESVSKLVRGLSALGPAPHNSSLGRDASDTHRRGRSTRREGVK